MARGIRDTVFSSTYRKRYSEAQSFENIAGRHNLILTIPLSKERTFIPTAVPEGEFRTIVETLNNEGSKDTLVLTINTNSELRIENSLGKAFALFNRNIMMRVLVDDVPFIIGGSMILDASGSILLITGEEYSIESAHKVKTFIDKSVYNGLANQRLSSWIKNSLFKFFTELGDVEICNLERMCPQRRKTHISGSLNESVRQSIIKNADKLFYNF